MFVEKNTTSLVYI